MGERVRGVPFVHLVEVVFIAVNDEVRSFLLVLDFSVSKDAGKLEDTIVKWIEAAHFEVDP